MKSCLVFLTKVYPFGTGEEFIGNELPIVAGKFDKVILIATSVPENAAQTRPVPANAEVHTIPAGAVNQTIRRSILKYFFACPKEYREERKADGAVYSPYRRLYFSYFLAKGAAVLQSAREILAKTNAGQYEAVTFYSYWFYDTAFAAIHLCGECRAAKRFVCSRAHGYDLYPERHAKNYLPFRTYLLQNLDGVYPCSEDGARYLRNAYPAFAGKVTSSCLGTPDRGIGPAGGGDAFLLVSCCHIVPVKRVDLLAKALAQLSGSGLKLRWVHFGGGGNLEELKQYAAGHLGFMKVEFAGEVTNQQILDFYRNNHVDLFVNTSSSEGIPVSIMEVCSFGIPVLATAVGGTPEAVESGRNGVLVDRDVSPEALAGAIAGFFRLPPQERSGMSEASRKIWEDRFSAETNYNRFAGQIQPK